MVGLISANTHSYCKNYWIHIAHRWRIQKENLNEKSLIPLYIFFFLLFTLFSPLSPLSLFAFSFLFGWTSMYTCLSPRMCTILDSTHHFHISSSLSYQCMFFLFPPSPSFGILFYSYVSLSTLLLFFISVCTMACIPCADQLYFLHPFLFAYKEQHLLVLLILVHHLFHPFYFSDFSSLQFLHTTMVEKLPWISLIFFLSTSSQEVCDVCDFSNCEILINAM